MKNISISLIILILNLGVETFASETVMEAQVEYGDRLNTFRIEKKGDQWVLNHRDSMNPGQTSRPVDKNYVDRFIERIKMAPAGQYAQECPRKNIYLVTHEKDQQVKRTDCLAGKSARSKFLTGLVNELATQIAIQ